jgi:hypothetical protein
MLDNPGNGIKIVTGVIGVGAALAAIELKVAAVGVKKGVGTTAAAASAVGASTKIAGGNTSGACMQAQINAISDQLHFQEEQILKLYALIDRDEQVFFKTRQTQYKPLKMYNLMTRLRSLQEPLPRLCKPQRFGTKTVKSGKTATTT